MKFAVFPYKMGSNSASELAHALGCKQIKHQGSKFQKYNNPNYWVINWGSDKCPSGHSVLNPPLNLDRSRNKLKFFNLVKDYCRVPDYTTSKTEAASWLTEGKCKIIVCRTTLTGHSGQGIVLAEKPEDLVAAPLYTRYVPKDSEFRLHFISGKSQPFFIQRKARKSDFEGEHNTRIRNLAGGYIYAHNDIQCPDEVIKQGYAAFSHSHLDFSAIDVIYNKASGKAYVLEANSAPGLEGATIEAYKAAFQGMTKNG